MHRFPCCTGLPLIALGLFLLLHSSSLTAQQEFRNQGGLDGDVPTPRLSSSGLSVQDPNAIAVIQAYLNATGLGSWYGLKATGTTTYVDVPDVQSTTLSMLPHNRTKLIATSSKGESITATNGTHGHIQYAGGKDAKLPALAVVGGILPFDLPALIVQAPASYTVVDEGTISVGGTPYHRVTVEQDIVEREAGAGEDVRGVIDLYFDPSTHLLLKSASIFQVPGAGRHRFVRVLTYGNYLASGAMRIPTLISETLDGQATWSLNLTSVNTTTPPASNIF